MELNFRKWHEEQLLEKPRNRWARWLILFGFGVSFGMTIWFVVSPSSKEHFTATIFLPLLIGTTFSPFAALLTPVSVITNRLDEYQRALRDRMQAYSFRILALAAVLLCAWGWLAADFDLPFPNTSTQWMYLQFLFLFGALVLPVALAEWIVPFHVDPMNEE